MQPNSENPTVDILSYDVTYQRASTNKRFLNYLIDVLVFYAVIFIVAVVLALLSPAFADDLSNDNPGTSMLERIISILLYAVYMSIVETIFNGKSIGKMITKTRAVQSDGSPITVEQAFKRGFSRAVPFAVFSAFGTPCNPWQDKWTDTMVIDDNKNQVS